MDFGQTFRERLLLYHLSIPNIWATLKTYFSIFPTFFNSCGLWIFSLLHLLHNSNLRRWIIVKLLEMFTYFVYIFLTFNRIWNSRFFRLFDKFWALFSLLQGLSHNLKSRKWILLKLSVNDYYCIIDQFPIFYRISYFSFLIFLASALSYGKHPTTHTHGNTWRVAGTLRTYAYIHTYKHANTRSWVCTCIRTYTRMHTLTFTRIHTHTHVQVWTLTHMLTHARAQRTCARTFGHKRALPHACAKHIFYSNTINKVLNRKKLSMVCR